jgi:hypothetical protein
VHWMVSVGAGVVWIGAVALVLSFSLDRAEEMAGSGVVRDPNTAQMAVAMVSAAVFALPGLVLVTVGFRRRRRGQR